MAHAAEQTTDYDFPTPKFRIGEAVYWATATNVKKQHPCPDCLGSGEWKVVTATDAELTLACPRCNSINWCPREIPSLAYRVWEPEVKQLTIGSVQINTAESYGDAVRYMCRETGVGSGSVYDESRLFASKDDALAAATVLAAEQNDKVVERPETLKAQQFSGLHFKDALFEGVHTITFSAGYHLERLLEELNEAVDDSSLSKAEFKECVEEILSWERRHRDPSPLKGLMLAAEVYRDDPAVAKALDAITPPAQRAKADTETENNDGR